MQAIWQESKRLLNGLGALQAFVGLGAVAGSAGCLSSFRAGRWESRHEGRLIRWFA